MSQILLHSINTRASYSERFENKRLEDVRNYSRIHRSVNAFEMDGHEDWMQKAKKTAEIFLVNPICRPSMSFVRNSRRKTLVHRNQTRLEFFLSNV